MTKTPRLTTTEEMIALAAREDMAKGTIGMVVIALVRASKPVSWPAITAELEGAATGTLGSTVNDVLAKGAIRFITTLP